MSKLNKMIRFIPGLYKPATNVNNHGLLTAWADEDDKIVDAVQNAKEQLFVATARLQYLEALGSNVGVFKPTGLNLADDQFRDLIPALSFYPKQVKPTIRKVLEIFFGHNNPNIFIGELNPNEMIIQIPSDISALRTFLKGSHHFHAYSGTITAIDTLNNEVTVNLDTTLQNLAVDELAEADFGQGVVSIPIVSNTTGNTGVTIQFPISFDISSLIIGRFDIANVHKYPGSFMPDPRRTFTATNQRGVLGQTICGPHVNIVSCCCSVVSPTVTMPIAAGDYSTFAIDCAQNLYSWGNGQNGVLGKGNANTECVPTQVGSGKWKAVTSATNSALGIDCNDKLFAWGNNNAGQIGTGNITNVCVPTAVCPAKNYKYISLGGSSNSVYTSSFAIDDNDDLYAWGCNSSWNLGMGNLGACSACIPTLVCGGIKWKMVAAATSSYALGVDLNGIGYAWGCNLCGKLGIGSLTNACVPVPICGGLVWQYLEATSSTSYGITCSGDMYAWGSNLCGKLGIGNVTSCPCCPTLVCCGLKWKAVASKVAHVLAITCDGDLYVWGTNLCGQLGLGDTNSRCLPTPLCSGTKFQYVGSNATVPGSSETGRSFAITCDGCLYAWGYGTCGALGRGNTTTTCVPSAITSPANYWGQGTSFPCGFTCCLSIAGQTLASITMCDSSHIPDCMGYLSFNLGYPNEEAPVKYNSRPNNSTLLLDPTYIFTKNHLAGEIVNFVVKPYQLPNIDGSDYSIYLVGVTAARILAQRIVESIVAAGVVIRWIVVEPDCSNRNDNVAVGDISIFLQTESGDQLITEDGDLLISE